jgi:hypothetical protein
MSQNMDNTMCTRGNSLFFYRVHKKAKSSPEKQKTWAFSPRNVNHQYMDQHTAKKVTTQTT